MKKLILVTLVDDVDFMPSKAIEPNILDIPEFVASNFGCILKGDEAKFFHFFHAGIVEMCDYAGLPDVVVINANHYGIYTTFSEQLNEIPTVIISNSNLADVGFQLPDFQTWHESGQNTIQFNYNPDPAINNCEDVENEYKDWIHSEINSIITSIIKNYAKV